MVICSLNVFAATTLFSALRSVSTFQTKVRQPLLEMMARVYISSHYFEGRADFFPLYN